MGQITPVLAMEMKVSRNAAQTLGIPFRGAAGPAALEAWAILLGIRFWRAKIKGDKLLIKSNSTVALAFMKKLSSGTPMLNWWGRNQHAIGSNASE